jgi:hypothetical protein
VDNRQAPSISTQAPAGGGECSVVGFGLGATGMTGGGIISGAWESADCGRRMNARVLSEMGYSAQAVALMRKFSEVDAVFNAQPAAAPARAPVADPHAIDLCWTDKQLAARYSECRQ